MMDMELENIVANTVYIKAREGFQFNVNHVITILRWAQAQGQEQEMEGNDAIRAPGPLSRCSNWYVFCLFFLSSSDSPKEPGAPKMTIAGLIRFLLSI